MTEIANDATSSGQEIEFKFPDLDECHKLCVSKNLSLELLETGRKDMIKFQESLSSHLSQITFDLVKRDALTPTSLANSEDKWSSKSDEKYWFIKSRYYSNDKKTVVDRKKGNKIVCPPSFVFDIIMHIHLLNEHLSCRPCHKNLSRTFANISRDTVKFSLNYCSVCNPEKKLVPLQKKKHRNAFQTVMPLERVHIEVFEPFPGELIEKKYSHVLMFRDYHSRYVWISPMKKLTFSHLFKNITKFILNSTRVPVYIESVSLEFDDLKEILGKIANEYELKLGIGSSNYKHFHRNGINSMMKLFETQKKQCLQNWNQCLKLCQNFHNNMYNNKVLGIPIDSLFHESHNSGHQYNSRKEMIIDQTFAKNVAIIESKKGLLYFEELGTFADIVDIDEWPGEEYKENPFTNQQIERSTY